MWRAAAAAGPSQPLAAAQSWVCSSGRSSQPCSVLRDEVGSEPAQNVSSVEARALQQVMQWQGS